MPENCVNNGTFGYFYECVDLQDDLAANERRVYQCTDANCLGKVFYTIAVQNDACFGAFSSSVKVTCQNGEYTRTDYPGSIDSTGSSNVTTAQDEACIDGQVVRCSSSVTLAVSAIILLVAVIVLLLLVWLTLRWLLDSSVEKLLVYRNPFGAHLGKDSFRSCIIVRDEKDLQ